MGGARYGMKLEGARAGTRTIDKGGDTLGGDE